MIDNKIYQYRYFIMFSGYNVLFPSSYEKGIKDCVKDDEILYREFSSLYEVMKS